MSQDRPPQAPCSLDELRGSVLALYVHHLRQSNLLTVAEFWPPAQHPQLESDVLWNPELDVKEVGITFADIQATSLAVYMEQQYQYAVNGVVTPGYESMEYESQHTWFAALLMDWAASHFVNEWESYGGDLRSHAERCLLISELANARLVLEGAEIGFSHFSAQGTRDQNATEFGQLTIRQMALLSGLEEMSVRTAASRKGPTQLKTHKNNAGRTVISPQEAKAWLQARGKYVPITRKMDRLLLDLNSTSFRTLPELSSALRDHCAALSARGPQTDKAEQVQQLFVEHGYKPFLDLWGGAQDCEPLLMQLASLLELPDELLILRVKECSLRQQLALLEAELSKRALAPR